MTRPGPRIVALGDSHLQRLGSRTHLLACPEHLAGAEVLNVAVGGSTTADLAAQIDRVRPQAGDRVLVSIGTNDAASWYPVELPHAEALLAGAVASLVTAGVDRIVLLTTPGVDRARLPQSNARTEADLSAFAHAFARVVPDAAAGVDVRVVEGRAALAPLGVDAFCDDGLHLSDDGYAHLIPQLAAELCGCPAG